MKLMSILQVLRFLLGNKNLFDCLKFIIFSRLRMGNLRGWGGPLSQAWHNKSIILQKQILERMREFGIITVLPAFAGHLPRAFKRFGL